jgi:DNA polymerase III alpha subunit
MGALFHDVPQALDNTLEIVDKCEHLKLKQGYPAAQFCYTEGVPRTGRLSAAYYF